MRCVIPGRSVKLFAKSIHCLSKIGDELYLEALPQGLAIRTVNSSRSAYACFMFHTTFFLSYVDGSDELPEDLEPDSLVKCKIAMKSCLAVFKSMNTIEKTVDRCKIGLSMSDARLVFLLYCRHGITKTHNLTFQECETLQAVFSKDLCPNFITSQARVLSETVFHFPNNQEELTLNVCPEMLKAKNYVDEEPDPNKVIRTEMTLVPEEFDNYQIGVDTEVTFCLKELRGILSFAEYASQPINLHFETGGNMDADSTYDADFVLATLVDQQPPSSSQAPSQTAAVASKPATRREKTKLGTSQAGAVSNNRRKDGNKTDGQHIVAEREKLPKTNKNTGTQGSAQRSSAAAVEQGETVDDHTEESRALDTNTSAAEVDNFFGDSFPYQDLFNKGNKKELPAIPQNSQDDKDISPNRSAQPIQTPPSSMPGVSNVSLPSLGESIVSPRSVEPKPAVTCGDLENSIMECVEDDEGDEFIPATPPSKKFKSMFFSLSNTKDKMRSQGVVLAPDTDDESD